MGSVWLASKPVEYQMLDWCCLHTHCVPRTVEWRRNEVLVEGSDGRCLHSSIGRGVSGTDSFQAALKHILIFGVM